MRTFVRRVTFPGIVRSAAEFRLLKSRLRSSVKRRLDKRKMENDYMTAIFYFKHEVIDQKYVHATAYEYYMNHIFCCYDIVTNFR